MNKPDPFQFGNKCLLYHNGCDKSNMILILYCEEHVMGNCYCPIMVKLRLNQLKHDKYEIRNIQRNL